jgi:hypothetical protein
MTVLFLDNDFLINTWEAAGQDVDLFNKTLDAYVQDHDVRITDVGVCLVVFIEYDCAS